MAEVKLKQQHTQRWEPPDIKEEPEPRPIKEEPEEIPYHVVTVKTEDDEDEVSVLHQRPTERNREESDTSDCGAEADCSSDPLTQVESDSEDPDSSDYSEETDSSDCTDHSEDYDHQQAPAKRSYAMIHPDSCVTDHRPFSCSDCGKSFRDKSDLRRHVMSVHKDWPHKCSVCEESFKVESSLFKHVIHDHRTCPLCIKHIPDEFKLKSHLRSHVNEGTLDQLFVKLSSCSECGKCFRDKSDLRRHMSSVHVGNRPHKCSVCERHFKEKRSLTVHLIHVHFICAICKKRFSDKTKLNSHMKNHVEEGTLVNKSFLEPFSCSDCEKSFRSSTDLRRHMSVHTRATPHKCSEHRPFSCPDCTPFRCSDCGKTFRWKSRLQNHVSVHRGEGRHKCDECGKRFRWSSHLQRHLTAVHRQVDQSPPKCKKM